MLAWVFSGMGLISLGWFLVRVIPKPSRAAYPCQRVAFPLASSFVVWVLAVLGSAFAWRKVRLPNQRLWKACLWGAAALAGGALVVTSLPTLRAWAGNPPHGPLGVAKGIFPGRVAWVRAPQATSWSGYTSSEHWFAPDHTRQAVVEQMVSAAVKSVGGSTSDAVAWDAIFRYFNQAHGRGARGYQAGEKIAIKINLTTCNARSGSATVDIGGTYEKQDGYWDGHWLNTVDNSPQVLLALLRQLVNTVGVAQTNIYLGDPTGNFPQYLWDPLYPEFPRVHYFDNYGGSGRLRSELSAVPFYWSVTNANTGQPVVQDYVPVPLAQADYLINCAVLKGHSVGVTLCGKNWYGSLLRCPDGYFRDASGPDQGGMANFSNMHTATPDPGMPGTPGLGHYRAIVDLAGSPVLGGKTLLCMVDGLYGGYFWDSHPKPWNMVPFNGSWPSSLFASQDPVAIDSVAYDFLLNEWPNVVNNGSDSPGSALQGGAEDYLHEAALADNPPSGTTYDPGRSGQPLASLGAHEHWNDPIAKQYSRNLDPANGQGIELVQLSATNPNPVTVGSYHGWNNAVFLNNGLVEAVIVPDAGRVLQFRFLGDTNGPFWENRSLDGTSANAGSWNTEGSFGGDKAWPSPQSDWGWPPPLGFDGSPCQVSLSNGVVTLTGPEDGTYRITPTRIIELAVDRPQMRVTTVFRRTSPTSLTSRLLGNWVITQVQDPAGIYVPVPSPSIFGSGYYQLGNGMPTQFRNTNNLISFTRDPAPNQSHKLGFDADSLAWVGTALSMRIDAPRQVGLSPSRYPDNGCNTEVYTNLGTNAPYVELECLGPLRLLALGAEMRFVTVYTLFHRTEIDPEVEARKILNLSLPAPTVPLSFALNNTNVTWTTDVSNPWYGQTAASHDSVASAQSGRISNGGQTTLTTSVSGPGTLTFWWKVSSQPDADFLSFRSGGISQCQISGEVDWQQRTVYLPAGQQALQWCYAKDGSLSAGWDAAWVDQVAFAPGGVPPSIVVSPTGQTSVLSSPVTFTVAAAGTPDLRYQWRFNGSDIPGASSTSYTLDGPSSADAGPYSVRVTNLYGSAISLDAVLTVRNVAGFGDNSAGQATIPAQATRVIALAAGSWHDLAVSTNGTVIAWGNDFDGQCDVPPGLTDVIAVAGGAYHSLALRANMTVAGWGNDFYGQSTVPAGLANVIAIAAGTWHSLALLANGTVVAWGDNSAGQISPPPGLTNVVAIAAGGNHNLALRADGSVVAWGENTDAQGRFVGQSVVPPDLAGVVAIAAGQYHSLAARADGTVVAWGDNSNGQAQPAGNLDPVVGLAAGAAHSAAVEADGGVVGWGNNWYGQCNLPTNLNSAIMVAAGNSHTLVLAGQPASIPQPTRFWWNGQQFCLLLQTFAGRHYALEYKNALSDLNWNTLPGLPGNGGWQFLVDRDAAAPQRYYRVSQW